MGGAGNGNTRPRNQTASPMPLATLQKNIPTSTTISLSPIPSALHRGPRSRPGNRQPLDDHHHVQERRGRSQRLPARRDAAHAAAEDQRNRHPYPRALDNEGEHPCRRIRRFPVAGRHAIGVTLTGNQMRLEGDGERVPAALPPAPVGAEPVVGRILDPIERTVVPIADGTIVAVAPRILCGGLEPGMTHRVAPFSGRFWPRLH